MVPIEILEPAFEIHPTRLLGNAPRQSGSDGGGNGYCRQVEAYHPFSKVVVSSGKLIRGSFEDDDQRGGRERNYDDQRSGRERERRGPSRSIDRSGMSRAARI